MKRESVVKFSFVFSICFLILLSGCKTATAINQTPVDVRLNLNKTRIYIGFPPFALSGGTPAGGTYSGPRVSQGKFSPEKAGVGVHKVTYTYDGIKATGTIVVFGVRKKVIDPNCPECNGTGKVKCSPKITCTTCDGAGRLFDRYCSPCDGRGRVRTAWKLWLGERDCPDCNGQGKIYKACPDCKGTGWEKCPKCKGPGKAPCSRCK